MGTNLKLVSEVMEIGQIELVARYADMLQVGARNMQNYSLLRELGKVRTPILLKRGIAATIEEWLLSAEYILSGATPTSSCASAAYGRSSGIHATRSTYRPYRWCTS